MTTIFEKYQGAGNDFVMIDNRLKNFPEGNSQKHIATLCNRHFGIGSDGLILLENHPTADFEMRYFNSDGHSSSMCGNGGRCAVAFASSLGMINDKTQFVVNGAVYHAVINSDTSISLQMQDVNSVTQFDSHCFVDTGSPHHVAFVSDVGTVAVVEKGRKIRYGKPYGSSGSNVNFVSVEGKNRLAIRTYERGVEAETLACGTGAVAAALAAFKVQKVNKSPVTIEALGGVLEVSFKSEGEGFTQIVLRGPAQPVYKGQWYGD